MQGCNERAEISGVLLDENSLINFSDSHLHFAICFRFHFTPFADADYATLTFVHHPENNSLGDLLGMNERGNFTPVQAVRST